MNAAAHRKEIIKLIRASGYRRHTADVFRDVIECAALAMSNSLDLFQREAREARYMQVVGQYDRDEVARFPQVLAHLVEAMEVEDGDVLGSLFGELELGNAAAGQFFTPYPVCRLMASLTVGDGEQMRAEIAKRGFVRAHEPAVGAGAQILALAEAMREAGLNYQQHLHVTAIDVDPRAVHMAYLQFSLRHIPAIVYTGNALSIEIREAWRTPAHMLGLWDSKLQRGYALGSEMDGAEATPEPMPPPVVLGEQLALFGAAA